MAIKRITDYLHKSTTAESLAKGNKIFTNGKVMIAEFDTDDSGYAILSVRSESNSRVIYEVKAKGFMGNNIEIECDCPYNWGGVCKHCIAALKTIEARLEKEGAGISLQKFKMEESYLQTYQLTDNTIKLYSSDIDWRLRNNITKVKLISAMNGLAKVEVFYKEQTYQLEFEKIENVLRTQCSCHQRLDKPLCAHKVTGLVFIMKELGVYAFNKMRNYDTDKNKLLAEYGYSLADKWEKKFSFQVSDAGVVSLIVLDKSIHKVGKFQNWNNLSSILKPKIQKSFIDVAATIVPEKKAKREYLYIFLKDERSYLGGTFVPYSFYYNAKNEVMGIKAPPFYQMDSMPIYHEIDAKIQEHITQLNRDTVEKYLKQKRGINIYPYFSDLTDFQQKVSPEIQAALSDYIAWQLNNLFHLLKEAKVAMAESQYIRSAKDLTFGRIVSEPIFPYLELKEEKEFVTLYLCFDIPNVKKAYSIEFVEARLSSHWIFLCKSGYICHWANGNIVLLADYFLKNGGKICVKKEYLTGFLHDFVLPLSQNFDIEFNIDRAIEKKDLVLQKKHIYLKESEDELFLVPAFVYGIEGDAFEFANDGMSTKTTLDEEDKIILWQRDWEAEGEFMHWIANQHENFVENEHLEAFSLPFTEVLKEDWLFHFFDNAKENEVEVLGYNSLKNMRYNKNRAKVQVRASSGIDWFDLKMEVSFGEQFVSLNDIKKAIAKKENYVRLGDGTLGVLPKEWLEKFSMMFRIGNVKGDNVKVSKLHFTLIDMLSDKIDNQKVLEELWDKKQKLLNFKEMKGVPLPTNIHADLRHYQEEGYKWLNFLDEFSWGGCLADDMGLGKTLQILAFLQNQKNLNPKAVNLVVVPTSLIFNWQAEAEKFTPELRLHVHQGMGRHKNTKEFKAYDIILTTYGMVRSDIELLSSFTFHYIILDESQAIKNPDSLISKAVRLLQAKNRLVMTGTPVENNTFDLYSQMEFLNPGLLGSQEAFKADFATPIDKYQDKEKAQALRKIVYPFMLKRTKEQVAKDLPDKTEITLYCEMGKKQRKIYDTFREKYRQQLTDSISEKGLNQSSFLILEGLLKLRQICDSPALLSEDAEYENESAKLDELIREIGENASNHKILIFSQFLGMLDLIRKHLETENIAYEYLDGKTKDRASRVNHFQEQESCRVFLVSLKAGGVGLNLTAADYVYLVDPWWNPAVERQAIDRTHRIGQTQKVFAYKMICKDTIEEKILLLQQKKQGIADDLINAEAGFIKKLSQDDIMGLFS